MRLLYFSRNFRFRPLACASYASPALDTTILPPEQAPSGGSLGFQRKIHRKLAPTVPKKRVYFSKNRAMVRLRGLRGTLLNRV